MSSLTRIAYCQAKMRYWRQCGMSHRMSGTIILQTERQFVFACPSFYFLTTEHMKRVRQLEHL